MAVTVCALLGEVPVFHATNAATDRHPVLPHSSVTVDLGDDLHDAAIDRVALTGQLRQLLEQHLQPTPAEAARERTTVPVRRA